MSLEYERSGKHFGYSEIPAYIEVNTCKGVVCILLYFDFIIVFDFHSLEFVLINSALTNAFFQIPRGKIELSSQLLFLINPK